MPQSMQDVYYIIKKFILGYLYKKHHLKKLTCIIYEVYTEHLDLLVVKHLDLKDSLCQC